MLRALKRNALLLVLATLSAVSFYIPRYLSAHGHRPPVGVYVAIMGFVIAAMALREEPGRWEKALWILFITMLMVAEIKNLYVADLVQTQTFTQISNDLKDTKNDLQETKNGLNEAANSIRESTSQLRTLNRGQSALQQSNNQIQSQLPPLIIAANAAALKEEAVRISSTIIQKIDDREPQSPRHGAPDEPARDVLIRKYDYQTEILIAPFLDQVLPLCVRLKNEYGLTCNTLKIQSANRLYKARRQAVELKELAGYL